MGDAFVTLIAVQPAVAAKSGARQQQSSEPQAALGARGGLFETLRNRQVVRGLGQQGGIPTVNNTPPSPTVTYAPHTGGGVLVSFALPTGADGFTLYWSNSPLFDRAAWNSLAVTGHVGSGTYEFALVPGTWYVAMAATNRFGEGTVTAPAQVVVPPALPAAPHSLIARPRLGAAFFWWEAVPGVASYALYYNAEGAGTALANQIRLPVGGQFVVLNLAAAQWYASVAAVDVTGREGPASSEIAFAVT